MIYLVALLAATSVGLLVWAVASVPSGQTRVLRRRLEELRAGEASYHDLRERRRRQAKRERLETLLEAVGERMGGAEGQRRQTMRGLLRYAGFRRPNALLIFLAARLLLAGGFGAGALFLAAVFPLTALQRLLLLAFGILLGWTGSPAVREPAQEGAAAGAAARPAGRPRPHGRVRGGGTGPQPGPAAGGAGDGPGEPGMSDELTLATLEIRAGTPREEALRNLADRNGLDDIRSLTGMLIQTDRFGTSIAQALRVHAESLRDKRRQMAEEAAAKTSVKMLFPLVFFVFPAIFIVLLGPSVFRLRDLFGGLGGP